MFTPKHSSDVRDSLAAMHPDEQDDYMTRLVPAVCRDPISNAEFCGRDGMAYRLGAFGKGRNVLIRVDYAEDVVWFTRVMEPGEVDNVDGPE